MPSGLPLSRLNLKVGATIILLCNLYPILEECNRTLIIIIKLEQHYIKARILDQEFQDHFCLILRINLITIESDMSYILSQ